MPRHIICNSCGYRGEAAPRQLSDILLGVVTLIMPAPGFVEHWRDIFAGKTCPRCANPKTQIDDDYRS